MTNKGIDLDSSRLTHNQGSPDRPMMGSQDLLWLDDAMQGLGEEEEECWLSLHSNDFLSNLNSFPGVTSSNDLKT